MPEDLGRKEIALAEYKEVVAQFRALTDIRFKLLTYLPLGTVAAVLVSDHSHAVDEPSVSAFAFVATLCIATYNKRNDQHYDELVSRAAELEREELGLDHGSFSHRPQSWLKYGPVAVEHRWPIGLLYAAAAALWASLLAGAIAKRLCAAPPPIWPEILAPALVLGSWQLLKWVERRRRKKLRFVVKLLTNQLVPQNSPELDEPQRKLIDAITTHQPLFGLDEKTAQRRVVYHWTAFEEKRDLRAASQLLGAVIDLPPRWIEDISGGRR